MSGEIGTVNGMQLFAGLHYPADSLVRVAVHVLPEHAEWFHAFAAGFKGGTASDRVALSAFARAMADASGDNSEPATDGTVRYAAYLPLYRADGMGVEELVNRVRWALDSRKGRSAADKSALASLRTELSGAWGESYVTGPGGRDDVREGVAPEGDVPAAPVGDETPAPVVPGAVTDQTPRNTDRVARALAAAEAKITDAADASGDAGTDAPADETPAPVAAPVKVRKPRARKCDAGRVADIAEARGMADAEEHRRLCAEAERVRVAAREAAAPAVPVMSAGDHVAGIAVTVGGFLNKWNAVAERADRLTAVQRVALGAQLQADFKAMCELQADADGKGTTLAVLDPEANLIMRNARKMIKHANALITMNPRYQGDRLPRNARRALRKSVAAWRTDATRALPAQ